MYGVISVERQGVRVDLALCAIPDASTGGTTAPALELEAWTGRRANHRNLARRGAEGVVAERRR
jgi:hypothetical protein